MAQRRASSVAHRRAGLDGLRALLQRQLRLAQAQPQGQVHGVGRRLHPERLYVILLRFGPLPLLCRLLCLLIRISSQHHCTRHTTTVIETQQAPAGLLQRFLLLTMPDSVLTWNYKRSARHKERLAA